VCLMFETIEEYAIIQHIFSRLRAITAKETKKYGLNTTFLKYFIRQRNEIISPNIIVDGDYES
jgi:hypothetical protein